MRLSLLALTLLLPWTAGAATTGSIRTPDGDLLEQGAHAGWVRDKLGAPQRVVKGGLQSGTEASGQRSNSHARLPVEYWTYVLGRQKYLLTLRGGRVARIEWDNLP